MRLHVHPRHRLSRGVVRAVSDPKRSYQRRPRQASRYPTPMLHAWIMSGVVTTNLTHLSAPSSRSKQYCISTNPLQSCSLQAPSSISRCPTSVSQCWSRTRARATLDSETGLSITGIRVRRECPTLNPLTRACPNSDVLHLQRQLCHLYVSVQITLRAHGGSMFSCKSVQSKAMTASMTEDNN